MTQAHAQKLNDDGGQENGNAALQNVHAEFYEEGLDDTAWKGDVDHQVGQQLPSLRSDGAHSCQEQAQDHDDDEHSLHLQQVG